MPSHLTAKSIVGCKTYSDKSDLIMSQISRQDVVKSNLDTYLVGGGATSTYFQASENEWMMEIIERIHERNGWYGLKTGVPTEVIDKIGTNRAVLLHQR